MSYKKADEFLPHDLLRAVQQYIDGASIYIPRKDGSKLPWGTNSGAKQGLLARNREIVARRLAGTSVVDLADQYFLSEKSIYKIISASRKD